MELLRVSPYQLTISYTVPDPSTEYILEIRENIEDTVVFDSIETSNPSSIITFSIPSSLYAYDESYSLSIYENDSVGETLIYGDLVLEDNLSIVRPYVDPNTLGTTASEIADYRYNERIARAIIDGIVDNGFYNKRDVLQRTGDGVDYFLVWKKTNKVLKAYENDVLVYDKDAEDPTDNLYEYKITLDGTAIYRVEPVNGTIVPADGFNRAESTIVKLPRAAGDLIHGGYKFVAFPKGYDYIFICDTGYKYIPSEIETAAKMLIEDLKCGKLEYFKKYVSSYSTDQFRMQFDKKMFDGTGNILVDKILENYVVSISKPGVI